MESARIFRANIVSFNEAISSIYGLLSRKYSCLDKDTQLALLKTEVGEIINFLKVYNSTTSEDLNFYFDKLNSLLEEYFDE